MTKQTIALSKGGVVRVVGPEPGLQYASPGPGLTLSQFGTYTRRVISNNGGPSSNFIKVQDTFLEQVTPTSESFSLLKFSEVQQWIIGTHGTGAWVFNMGDPAFQNYIFNTYMTRDFLPHTQLTQYGHLPTASNPCYVGMDGFNIDYNFPHFTVPNPPTAAQWYAGWTAFFQYALAHRPEIRLHPHMSGLSDWSVFRNIFQYVPAQMKEHFEIGDVPKMGVYERKQVNQQIINTYWFANQAPPLFFNDPPTRVVTWGTSIANGDYHSAFALYCLVRGPNTFFELLSGSAGVDPQLWSGASSHLGPPVTSNGPQTIGSGSLGALYQRNYPHGLAYFNFTGSAQTVSLPAGATDWAGNPLTVITIPDGTGAVVLT